MLSQHGDKAGRRLGAARVSRGAFAGGGTALASIAILRAPAPAAEFTFKCAGNQPAEHPLSVRMVQMWNEIKKESGGRIDTKVYPNSVLGSDTGMFAQLRLGAIDFMQITPANLASIIPVTDISYLGFAFKDATEALRVMDGPLGAYMRNEIAAKGMHSLPAMWDSGMVQISSGTHPIRTPDDLRGFKVRITESKITVDLFKGLGANPTPISKNELYTALQTKLVDGTASSLGAIDSAKYYEIQKYISITNHSWSGYFMIANGDTWKRLPPDLQQIVERVSNRISVGERRDTRALDASVGDKLVREGMIANRPDQEPFRRPLSGYYHTWAATFGTQVWGLLQGSLGRSFV